MSNVDVVSRCIDAISKQDTVYRGPDGVDDWMRDLKETWAELRIDVHEIAETEPDYVVAKATLRNRGHASDVPTQMPVELHARLRDGLVPYARVVTGQSTR
jgi:hypothetical protein